MIEGFDDAVAALDDAELGDHAMDLWSRVYAGALAALVDSISRTVVAGAVAGEPALPQDALKALDEKVRSAAAFEADTAVIEFARRFLEPPDDDDDGERAAA